MAHEFTFQQLIEAKVNSQKPDTGSGKLEVDYGACRLVRHDSQARRIWRASPAYFEHWASFQDAKQSNSPYNNCRYAFHFIPVQLPDGSYGATFICAHEVKERWIYEGPEKGRQPKAVSTEFMDRHQPEKAGIAAHDLHRLALFDEFSEKVVVFWSATSHGTRSWSQWWRNRPKPIVELRLAANEVPFPGFAELSTTLNEIDSLPASWRNALSSVGGVYMLVCPDTGQQYVGSATSSEGGFMERWDHYAADGHGGNLYLKARAKRHNYTVFILELATPLMSRRDVLRREYAWMGRLGTKVHGLNHDPKGKPLA